MPRITQALSNNCKALHRTSKLSAHLFIRLQQHPQISYILHTGTLMGNGSEWLTQLFQLIRFIVWIKPQRNGSREPDERCQERCSLCLWPDPCPLMQYLFGGLILFVRARNYNSRFFFSPSKNEFPFYFYSCASVLEMFPLDALTECFNQNIVLSTVEEQGTREIQRRKAVNIQAQ